MTYMSPKPLYGKGQNQLKMALKLVCSIMYSSTTKIVQMMTLGRFTLTYLKAI